MLGDCLVHCWTLFKWKVALGRFTGALASVGLKGGPESFENEPSWSMAFALICVYFWLHTTTSLRSVSFFFFFFEFPVLLRQSGNPTSYNLTYTNMHCYVSITSGSTAYFPIFIIISNYVVTLQCKYLHIGVFFLLYFFFFVMGSSCSIWTDLCTLHLSSSFLNH